MDKVTLALDDMIPKEGMSNTKSGRESMIFVVFVGSVAICTLKLFLFN